MTKNKTWQKYRKSSLHNKRHVKPTRLVPWWGRRLSIRPWRITRGARRRSSISTVWRRSISTLRRSRARRVWRLTVRTRARTTRSCAVRTRAGSTVRVLRIAGAGARASGRRTVVSGGTVARSLAVASVWTGRRATGASTRRSRGSRTKRRTGRRTGHGRRATWARARAARSLFVFGVI